MTITQRLLLTFSSPFRRPVSMVIVAIVVAGGFQSRFQYVQENTVPSLLDIGKWSMEVTPSLSGYTAIRVQQARRQAEGENNSTALSAKLLR